MRIAILDPFAGISGDMTLGALVDAGVDRAWLEGLPPRLGLDGVRVRIERVERAGVAAIGVAFEIPQRTGHDGRHLDELLDLVRRAPLSDWVQERAVRAFELLGEAEGRVHGVAPGKVHLHEVGAVDAVLDVVGAIEGFERLGVDAIYNLPVAMGTGWVDAAHGALPVPAPATTTLLHGVELRQDGPVVGEATTPTGAALIRVLSRGSPPKHWRVVSQAWGAGARNPKGYPNALRLLVAEGAPEAGIVEVIATDIDDLSPEYVAPLREAMFAAGALDCAIWSTHGKKGRVALRIEAMAPPGIAERVVEALFRHSTTGGIRRWLTTRATLRRREIVVELERATRVRVKVWDGPFGTRLKAEYDDVVAAAAKLHRPALEIVREVERLADVATRNGNERRNAANKE